jgi:hypothetical protein
MDIPPITANSLAPFASFASFAFLLLLALSDPLRQAA